jgi:hypothetical protein
MLYAIILQNVNLKLDLCMEKQKILIVLSGKYNLNKKYFTLEGCIQTLVIPEESNLDIFL